MTDTGLSVTEMAHQLDAHADAAERVKDFGTEIYREVVANDGTNPVLGLLADMVVVRSGIYISETVRQYREAEERIAEGVGETAFVIIEKSSEWWTPSSRRGNMGSWVPGRRTQFEVSTAGRISAPDPIVDDQGIRWKIPVQQYASRRTQTSKYKVSAGPMPVKDLLEYPDDVRHRSALNQAQLESGIFQHTSGGDVEDPLSGGERRSYRMLMKTILLIGNEEISELKDREPHLGEIMAVIENKLEVAANKG